MVAGKLEVTIKINSFPDDVKTVENGWKQFIVETGNQNVVIKVKPKVFKKLEDAQANYEQWVAAIAGTIGAQNSDGFILDMPNIQTFEKKSKPKDSE